MAKKMIMGPGGEYYGERDPQEEKLTRDMMDALSSDYTTAMDFLGAKREEREHFKKGGGVSGIFAEIARTRKK